MYIEENTENGKPRPSVILTFFSDDLLKKLYYNAWRTDICDLNLKASIASMLMSESGFDEIGTGTNRIVFNKNGLIFKVAIDIPGFTDNLTEFKRSTEKSYFPTVYECNYLICVEEYWTVMDLSQFYENREGILTILKDLSESYIFDDVGFQPKNYLNWGFREKFSEDDDESVDGEIGILDYGYLYPKYGQEDALSCPICGSELRYNNVFTEFICTSSTCRKTYPPDDIVRRMDMRIDNYETRLFTELSHIPEPIIKFTNKRKKNERED